MTATWMPEFKGFSLGHGCVWNPAGERMNGLYRFVGLLPEGDGDGDTWLDIAPCQDEPWVTENPWLETVGPGHLVFIPDTIDVT